MREFIKVGLRDEEYRALAQLADDELRPLPMQAQHIIVEALRDRCLIPTTSERAITPTEPRTKQHASAATHGG